ncbi:MAG TPA: type III-A CRISPR-associated RAMP protein Csm3 [Syntrophales bacterium]|nr:type III-A CRISPR-associated RAMP protein Csm3 [Syntrophales bacterium]
MAQKLLLGKVFLRGGIVLKTGLHIGGSSESMQIGGLDSPIIRDSSTNLPYIPGSSLKGKLRSILERFGERLKDGKTEKLTFNRNIGTFRNKLFIHCCEDAAFAMQCDVCRIFGSSGDDRALRDQKAENMPALLMVRDCMLDENLLGVSASFTEVKVETGLDRSTMSANLRRVERVLPETRFNFELVYTVEANSPSARGRLTFREKELKKDLDNLLTCLEIVQSEGIGGYVSRGYGKVAIHVNEFTGKSLNFFKGNEKEFVGSKNAEMAIGEARTKIDEIVAFFKKEAENALRG